MSRSAWSLLMAGLMFVGVSGVAQPLAAPANGHWEGKIDIPEHPITVNLDLAKDAKGAWVGSVTIPGTTAADVPVSGLAVNDSTVRFSARLPEPASFEGRIGPDGSLSGTASNAQGGAPFRLIRAGDANVKLPSPSSLLSKEFAGDWLGAIEREGNTLHIALKLASTNSGPATATLVSVDQNNAEIPIDTVTIHDKDLQLESRAVSGKYVGTLGANGEISGQWSQGTRNVALNFKRTAANP